MSEIVETNEKEAIEAMAEFFFQLLKPQIFIARVSERLAEKISDYKESLE